MMHAIEQLSATRLWALIVKETREIFRNKYLVFLLLVPPTVQLLILGAALDPQVRRASLGIVDYAQSRLSRDLIESISGTGLFPDPKYFSDTESLSKQLERGRVDAGVVIPEEFTKELELSGSAPVQVLIDGTDAYSAGIINGYLVRTIRHFRPGPTMQAASPIEPRIVMLYNPGQVASWTFVPGVLGATLTLTATLVASATLLRERESGTMEQLLMTPAESWEILMAKVIPLVVFLVADVVFAVSAAHVAFGLPFRGNVLLFLLASLLYVFVGIGLGMLLGTLCRRQRQAQLSSFFMNIPLIMLSGTVVPFDTMPPTLQMLSAVDPLRYYAIISRSVILKGTGLPDLWAPLLVLALFAIIVPVIGVCQFRRTLA